MVEIKYLFFNAGIKMLIEGKYLVDFNSEVSLKSVCVHFAPGKIAITLELLGQFDQNGRHFLAIILIY